MRALIKRLVDREIVSSGEAPNAALATALVAENLCRALSRWIGIDGCHALFRRARADALTDHPALAKLELRAREESYLGNVAACIEESGDTATANGLEAMLGGTIELLGRLIGHDLATNLIERSLPESALIADPEKRRAEA